MPWVIQQSGNQYCVHKKGSANPVAGGCHSTREQALRHMRALYANIPEGRMSESFLVSLGTAFSEDNIIWLEALPAKTWHTVDYGEVPISIDKLERMVKNFHSNVRGQEIATNYDHGTDRAKGNKASGWFRDFKVAPSQADPNTMSLHAAVQLTEEAAGEISDKQWRYFSLEWEDAWQHPETQEMFEDVIVGGGFTNRPIAKGMTPINFSEIWEEVQMASKRNPKEPYGNVAYADPGYQPDKKKRYPLDTETHIRAAWSYINKAKNAAKYTSSQLASIKGKIRSAMRRLGANVAMSESELDAALSMSEAELMTVPEEELEGPEATSPELELSEPGTGPAPALDEVGDRSGGADQGSRIDTPPNTDPEANADEGGVMSDLDRELRELLELDDDADIVARVSEMRNVAAPLEEAAVLAGEQRAFSERYPEEAAELKRLREESVSRQAKSFAESCGKLRLKIGETQTEMGFSAIALEKIENAHRKFSEGAATLSDFEAVLSTVMGSEGIVDFAETGSSVTDDLPLQSGNPRIAFAELIKRVIEDNDGELEYADAVREAAKKNPELAEAYRNYKPAA
jgi:hypothetical protein